MKKIRVGAVSLAVEVEDPDRRPWVTFSHSHATDLSIWEEQVAHLHRDFRILRYDTRGHGASDAPAGPCSIDTLVSDVIGLWDALGIESSHFVGLSLGGTTGLGLAIHYPHRVSKVVACNCHSHATREFSAAWNPRIETALQRGMSALVQPTLDRWFTPGFIRSHPDKITNVARMIETTSVNGYVECARALQNIDYEKFLQRIRIPTLFIAGAQDKAAPAEGLRLMRERVIDGRYAELDPAGHLSNLESPMKFNENIAAFLRDS